MRRKGIAIWITRTTIKPIACFLGIMIILILPLTDAQDTFEETHEIDLYMSGKGTSTHFSHRDEDDLSTRVPILTLDDSHTFKIIYQDSELDPYYWHSDPLHMNITLIGDVHLSIWATCNPPRDIAFSLGMGIYKSRNSGGNYRGHISTTDVKMVHNEPVNFYTDISEESLGRDVMANYSTGESIYMSVEPIYQSPQPPANVTILYNSTNHPSGITINTTSVSIDISDSEVRNGEAFVGVNITNAFGVYDIADYNVNITDPLGLDFKSFNIAEGIIQENGQIILNLTWDMAGFEAGNYIINVTVVDNNKNIWWKEETHYFNPLDGDHDPDDGKEEGSVQPFIPLIVIIILSIIFGIGSLLKKMKKDMQPPKRT